ncbi:MAG: ImmA/IrrE family metallo-endopeptidase [Desulfobacteraceae bacterium]|nr:MAG: ImmA/IrrE family metallo-endopeptidase [Desulfobacteraceae bacterium]
MDSARRSYINRLGEIIREVAEVKTPVDVETLAKSLGGSVTKKSSLDYEAKVEKEGDGFKITLSKKAFEARKRFTIAHELGHLFLHMGYLLDEDKWNKTGVYSDSVYYRHGHSQEEYEANEFAGSLLMPKAEFISVAERHCANNKYSVLPIAKHFDVSVDAAITRGRWLGLFSWS